MTTAMQHPGRESAGRGPNLFPKMAPAWDQQKPRAVLSEKHGNEIGTAYLPLKLLRSIQRKREKQMCCNYSLAMERQLGQASDQFCLAVFSLQNSVLCPLT